MKRAKLKDIEGIFYKNLGFLEEEEGEEKNKDVIRSILTALCFGS